MFGRIAVFALSFGAACFTMRGASPVTPGLIQESIRANDLVRLRTLVTTKESANLCDRLNWTPLHYAAMYGSPEAVAYLLSAGADAGARNQQGATPLVYGAWNLRTTRLLVEHGADVNAAADRGTTPLMIASASGNHEAARYLLEHHADTAEKTSLGVDALMCAAMAGNEPTLKLLLNRGVDPKSLSKNGTGALDEATGSRDYGQIQLLLDRGANPNTSNLFGGQVKNGPIQLVHLTPLMTAVPSFHSQSVDALLRSGAHVNDVDIRKMNALMLAIATDHGDPTVVARLVAAGADLKAKDIYGASAMDWAMRFKNPAVLDILRKARAPTSLTPAAAPVPAPGSEAKSAAEAVNRSVKLFAQTEPMFFKQGGGCNGCHNQPIYGQVYGTLKREGKPVDASLRQGFLSAVTATRPRLLSGLTLLEGPPGDLDSLLNPMMAMIEMDEPSSSLTDAIVHYLAARQDVSGGWIMNGIARPPIEDSNISRTAYAIQGLSRYGWPARESEFKHRIERARTWLREAKPVTTYDHADRIAGLRAAGEPAGALEVDAAALLALQRADGGWAQTPFLESDAYATGLVLHTLYRAGLLKCNDEPYRRGVAFLLRTQFPDGSWYVRSRTPKFQPYFQSGFPFEHDQWISSSGSAWATMALAHAM